MRTAPSRGLISSPVQRTSGRGRLRRYSVTWPGRAGWHVYIERRLRSRTTAQARLLSRPSASASIRRAEPAADGDAHPRGPTAQRLRCTSDGLLAATASGLGRHDCESRVLLWSRTPAEYGWDGFPTRSSWTSVRAGTYARAGGGVRRQRRAASTASATATISVGARQQAPDRHVDVHP